jgi:chemotaxis signal transduction protein
MSDAGSWLMARAGGRELLISMHDLREVVAPMPVSPLPGSARGIGGVVIHQGEFLPVLAWGDLPGCPQSPVPPAALAVGRLRLGIPLERLGGALDLGTEDWREPPADDPWRTWVDAVGRVGDRELPRIDLDRLIALLRRYREER